jgi:hypothetical protein
VKLSARGAGGILDRERSYEYVGDMTASEDKIYSLHRDKLKIVNFQLAEMNTNQLLAVVRKIYHHAGNKGRTTYNCSCKIFILK